MKYKNIFILCTGRSGSSSFIAACKHITNYSSGHETLSSKLGKERFSYPEKHIEADNRLTWFLGALGTSFSDNETLYVHLIRDRNETIASFDRRWNTPNSIIKAFSEGILKIPLPKLDKSSSRQVCADYYDTVNSNISYFLQKKPHAITVDFKEIKASFEDFWKKIGAEGNLQKTLSEFDIQHNKSKPKQSHTLRYRLKLLLMKLK